MVKNTLIISAMKVVRRLTKQKDRVKIENSDILAGAEFAESLHGSLSVSGWYHSHPHITVPPSHFDLATQASYQTMNKNFVGLIFSVFNYDHNTHKKWQHFNRGRGWEGAIFARIFLSE